MMTENVLFETDIMDNRDTKSILQVIETPYELVYPQTIGELRKFLEPFSDECKLMSRGTFRFVIDGHGNGTILHT